MIIHFTTVHPRDDSRIRTKELNTLAGRFGGRVSLFVQDGLGTEIDPDYGYRIVDTGPRLRRLKSILLWRRWGGVLYLSCGSTGALYTANAGLAFSRFFCTEFGILLVSFASRRLGFRKSVRDDRAVCDR